MPIESVPESAVFEVIGRRWLVLLNLVCSKRYQFTVNANKHGNLVLVLETDVPVAVEYLYPDNGSVVGIEHVANALAELLDEAEVSDGDS